MEDASGMKPYYGIDAPGVVRNLAIACIALCLVSVYFPMLTIGSLRIELSGLIWSGFFCGLGATLMLGYSLYGKYRHRDKMLNFVTWSGNEQLLDIGTGLGLLMIGAAHKIINGKSIGIDIWNVEDLTGNTLKGALKNAKIEGVAHKVEILNENVMDMSFANNTFDVILTNMCLHNIYTVDGRKTACEQIARVLKKDGTAVISDWKHVKEYNQHFIALGLRTELLPAAYFTTFPAITTLIVKK